MSSNAERPTWEARATLRKWEDAEAHKSGAAPDETIDLGGNMLLTAGVTALWNLVTGAGGTAYDATNARLGVGEGATAATAGDTALVGPTTAFQVVDQAPAVSGNEVTFEATFGDGTAEFPWNEWAVDNGTTLLNRKAVGMGTKAAGSTWTLTVTIAIS